MSKPTEAAQVGLIGRGAAAEAVADAHALKVRRAPWNASRSNHAEPKLINHRACRLGGGEAREVGTPGRV